MIIQFILEIRYVEAYELGDAHQRLLRIYRSAIDGSVNDYWKINRLHVHVIIPCNIDMIIALIKRRRDAAYSFTLFPAVIVRDSILRLALLQARARKRADNIG